jgi:ankyrin repeat protein
MSATLLSSVIKDINAKRAKPVAEWLKKNKDKPNPKFTDPSKQEYSYTLLHKAVEVGDPDILAAFFKAGVDLNSKDSAGCTPLHWCADRSTAVHHKVAGA